MKFDLSWGDPIIVRQALTESLGLMVSSHHTFLEDILYPPFIGNDILIEQLKNLAFRQSRHKPKHLIITCGATGAINAALYALKTQRTDWVVTNKRYFPIYPKMIGLTDMIMIDKTEKDKLIRQGCEENNFVSLIDSPSNPEGLVSPFNYVDVWDAAYASKTYSSGGHVPYKYAIMCGSLSKTLGLSGLRLGWASTDDDVLANSILNYVTASYVGLSSVSMNIAEEVLSTLDFDTFEIKAKNYLDSNREEVQKLAIRFGYGEVPARGMFAIVPIGKAEKKVLEKAKIKWQSGETWGEDENWARLSLGQTREITRSAIRAALK